MSPSLPLTAIATLAAAFALSASAQPAPDAAPAHPAMMMMMHHHLAAMDKNGDGFITRDEFLAHPAAMFAKLDANGDGRISKDELAAMHGAGGHGAMHMGGGGHMAMMRQHMDKLDTDHDGRISLAELEAPLHRHFEMLDKNKDGFIEKDELPAGPMAAEKHAEPHD